MYQKTYNQFSMAWRGGGDDQLTGKNFGVGIQIIQSLRNNQSKCIYHINTIYGK